MDQSTWGATAPPTWMCRSIRSRAMAAYNTPAKTPGITPLMAQLIDGKAVAAKIREQVRLDSEQLKAERGVVPGLAVVRVGEDPGSKIYVAGKQKAARE